jgi:hypothetical protein
MSGPLKGITYDKNGTLTIAVNNSFVVPLTLQGLFVANS